MGCNPEQKAKNTHRIDTYDDEIWSKDSCGKLGKEQEEHRYRKEWVQEPQVHTRQDYFSRCEDDCTENPHKVGKNILGYQLTSLFSLFLINHITP